MGDAPIRVLLVDDDGDDHLLVRNYLARAGGARYDLEAVGDYDSALAAIRQGRHDAYLVDFRLGGRSGLDLLREAVAGGCPGPFILLTGQGGREVDLEAMRAGAADYLPKGELTAALLDRSVRYAVERRRAEAHARTVQKMEAVGRLAGGIAHTFNNLMTVVTGYTEVLLDRLPPGDPSRPLVEEVRHAGERAAGLTRQLLAFGRQQMLTPRVLDLNAVVTAAAERLQELCGAGVRLVTDLDPALGSVRADPDQAEQVLADLVANARDALPRGGTVTVETRNVTLDAAHPEMRPEIRPGRYALLAVRDDGDGMDGETVAHVFEPFFTTKEADEGAGLGLATVYGVVKQSGGYVYAFSEPGRGSTFKVYLPLAEEPADRPVRDYRPAAPGEREVVLVVEDEPAVRGLVRMVLDQRGYAVLEAGDGEEALRVVGAHPGPIRLLVTDVVMPGMAGTELAARLKLARPGLRVIYTSGYAADAAVRRGVLAEGTPFLQKPFSPAALARTVREVLDRPGSGVVPVPTRRGGGDG